MEQWTCDPCKNHKNIKATSVTKRSRFFVFNSFVAHDPLINWIILAIAGTGLCIWVIDLRSIDLGFITHAPPFAHMHSPLPDPFKLQDVLTDLHLKKVGIRLLANITDTLMLSRWITRPAARRAPVARYTVGSTKPTPTRGPSCAALCKPTSTTTPARSSTSLASVTTLMLEP